MYDAVQNFVCLATIQITHFDQVGTTICNFFTEEYRITGTLSYNGWSCICGCQGRFIMETVVFWHCDNGYRTKNNSFGVNSAISIIICSRWLILIKWSWDILNRAIFLPNMHWCANKGRSWLLRTLAFRIIWIHWLSLPLYNTHPAWLSLTNELKFVDKRHQINSLSLVNQQIFVHLWGTIMQGPYTIRRLVDGSVQEDVTLWLCDIEFHPPPPPPLNIAWQLSIKYFCKTSSSRRIASLCFVISQFVFRTAITPCDDPETCHD